MTIKTSKHEQGGDGKWNNKSKQQENLMTTLRLTMSMTIKLDKEDVYHFNEWLNVQNDETVVLFYHI